MQAVIAFVVGAVLGAAFLYAWRQSVPMAQPEPAEQEISEGAGDVLRAALDVLRSAVVVVDAEEDVVLANQLAHSFNVVRRQRLAIPALVRLVKRTRRSAASQQAEIEHPTMAGVSALLAHTTPVGDAGHVLVMLEDITDARRLEAVRRDFVANVSHELKTPVGALSLLAEAVYDAADDPAAVRHFAESMSREAARLARLVQELIDLSRIQGAEPMPEPGAVPLASFVREAVDRARLNADAKQISIVVGDLSGLQVWGDARQLATACANLLDNAIAYSPDGTRVAIGARRGDGQIEISVADQGIGIADADKDRIFERFYRADPARSRATGGTGLGLAIVKHIAGNHGGRVTVWSDEGAGSTFTLHLPEAPPEARTGTGAA
ncbi:MAG: ATP-binding protein [Mycobacteriales bacterium]